MNKLIALGLPIGNIEDITLRGLKVIFSFDVIVAEDTRNYIKLRNILSERFPEIIKNLGLQTEHRPELISYREQNHLDAVDKVKKVLREDKTVALISDAGMPSISDPGYKLIKDLVEDNFEVEVFPGPTAVETALTISGIPTDRFSFLGFLPREKGKIKKVIEKFLPTESTLVFYESPFRVIKTLEIVSQINTNFQVAICNDLTKKFEKTIRGDIITVIEKIKKIKVQGEWVILLKNSAKI